MLSIEWWQWHFWFSFQSRSSSSATIGTNRPSEVDDEDDEPLAPPPQQQRLIRAGSTTLSRAREAQNAQPLSTPSTSRKPPAAASVRQEQQQPAPAPAAKAPARKVAPSPQPARRTLSPRKGQVLKGLFQIFIFKSKSIPVLIDNGKETNLKKFRHNRHKR